MVKDFRRSKRCDSQVATENIYGLLTKLEVKMAAYWRSSFFTYLWPETDSRSITERRTERQRQSDTGKARPLKKNSNIEKSIKELKTSKLFVRKIENVFGQKDIIKIHYVKEKCRSPRLLFDAS